MDRAAPSQKPLFLISLLGTGGYVFYMTFFDVPMYIARFLADEKAQVVYKTLLEGLDDIRNRWIVTFKYDDWQAEMPWMSLYFSFAVWFSILLIKAPEFQPMSKPEDEASL